MEKETQMQTTSKLVTVRTESGTLVDVNVTEEFINKLRKLGKKGTVTMHLFKTEDAMLLRVKCKSSADDDKSKVSLRIDLPRTNGLIDVISTIKGITISPRELKVTACSL